MLTADRLKSGVPAVVKRLYGTRQLKRRLSSLGVIPGASVIFIRKAPFGDPLEFKVSETRIVVRKSEARSIFVDYDRKNWTKRLFL